MLYNFDALSFEILSIFRFRHADGSFSAKPRPYAALAFRLQGQGEFYIEGNRMPFSAGDIVFLPSDMPYEVKYFDSEIIVVHLMHCNYHAAEIFHPENPALFRASFLRLCEEWNEKHSVNRAKSILYDVFDRMESERKKALGGTPIDVCLSYMEANFCNPELEIGEVCAVGFMSQSSLQRAFRERFGMSPKAYLCKLRMHRAMELLLSRNRTVKEIAFACGFSDEKFFSRVIKQKYGVSPSQLLKNHVM